SRAQGLTNAGHGEDWPNAGDGIAWREDHGFCRSYCLQKAGCRPRPLRANEPYTEWLNDVPLAHEVLLKAQLTYRGEHARLNPVIAHRQQRGFDAELRRDFLCGFGQGSAGTQQLSARQVHGQIAIAELEPSWHAELAHGFQAAEAFVLHSPATLATEQAGEAVENRINI